KIVSHHLGGMIPFFWGRINETYSPADQQKTIGRTLPEPLFKYFSLFYYDTAVGGSVSAVKCAYDVFGASQLVFATDNPHGPGTGEIRLATYPGVIKSLGLSEAENKQIFEGNARKILGLI
ncbi:MAG: amidohydrolase family protein, partial [Dehalococcoidia bacterium]|nr:amidohydrolase family protein [Dehalococcoidia bacterium]